MGRGSEFGKPCCGSRREEKISDLQVSQRPQRGFESTHACWCDEDLGESE